jgi:hypothetical protein
MSSRCQGEPASPHYPLSLQGAGLIAAAAAESPTASSAPGVHANLKGRPRQLVLRAFVESSPTMPFTSRPSTIASQSACKLLSSSRFAGLFCGLQECPARTFVRESCLFPSVGLGLQCTWSRQTESVVHLWCWYTHPRSALNRRMAWHAVHGGIRGQHGRWLGEWSMTMLLAES